MSLQNSSYAHEICPNAMLDLVSLNYYMLGDICVLKACQFLNCTQVQTNLTWFVEHMVWLLQI